MKPLGSPNKAIQFVIALVLIFSVIAVEWPAEAHAPGVVLSGFGTATIDGVLSPGEWDSAGSIDFSVTLPGNDGGGTTPAILFVMNDGTNLYLGLKIVRSALGSANVVFTFDNNHNGVPGVENGDDVLGFSFTFLDNVRTNAPPCPPGPPGYCGPRDAEIGGSTDGQGAATNDGEFSFYELSHPLNSGDPNDFSLSAGQTVGFTLSVTLFSLVQPCSSDCGANTIFPIGGCCNAGDIVIEPRVIRVDIDIKPGSFPNSINPRSHGVIPVGILTTDTFDATTVDPATVRFGATGGEAVPDHSALEDVDGDGNLDMILHFRTQATGIGCGNTSASLTGQTTGGELIEGSDSIRTVGCK